MGTARPADLRPETYAIQQGTGHVEIQDADDYYSVHCRGGVLRGINGGKRGPVPPQAPRAYGIHPSVVHACLRSQHGLHLVG